MPPSKDRKRAPTLRKMTSSLSDYDDPAIASRVMSERTESMGSRAADGAPLTDEEVRDVLNSLRNVAPRDAAIDWEALGTLLSDVAHLSHKDWDVTGRNSRRLADLLLPGDGDGNGNGNGGMSGGLTDHAHQMFERILHEGNWDGALEHAKNVHARSDDDDDGNSNKPWAVLVTGVNGIRKTTSIYQPWFSQVLREALIPPSSPAGGSGSDSAKKEFPLEVLPNGHNSFFRQLDHMIATLCNEDFSVLYALTGAQLQTDTGDGAKGKANPPKELIDKYSGLKASIFSRYRTLSELLGVLLLKEAQAQNVNAMCETSGRDIAMFHYVDHFFDVDRYNKLALHFTIDDLGCARRSVDERMVREMRTGGDALASGDVVEVIYANAGGPYGSGVLAGVQADSDRVWDEVVMKGGGGGGDDVGGDWYKATLRIYAHKEKPWTIRAVRPDGSLGTEYEFGDPRIV